MPSRFKLPIISFSLIVLVTAPVVITGYAERWQAESARVEGDFAQAAAHFNRAALFQPWDPDLWEEAGNASMKAGDFSEAISMFETTRQRNALSPLGWESFGYAYWSNSQYGEALEIWKAGLENYPSHTEFYRDLSVAYQGLGQRIAEEKALKIWIASGKANAAAHYRFAQLILGSDPERASQELLIASQQDPEYESVYQTLRRTIILADLEADESRRLVMIGRGLGLVNEWALATESFQQAIDAERENAEAWAWLGEAKQHLSEQGRVELDHALQLDGRSATVRGLRGLYWKRQEKYQYALAEYYLAAGLEPENPVWQASIADSLTRLGDLVSALTAYQRAAQIAPNDPTYWRLLAIFCAENGVQVEETGLPAALNAVELAPEDAQALDALGWNYLSSGNLSLAEQTLREASQQDADYLPARLHLGMTYLALGNRNAAYVELNHVHNNDPNGLSGQTAERLLSQYFP